MSHRLDVRIPDELFKELRQLDGKMSDNCRIALRTYINQSCNTTNNTDIVHLLSQQITDLKEDKSILQRRIDYYMLPWYQRILLPKHK